MFMKFITANKKFAEIKINLECITENIQNTHKMDGTSVVLALCRLRQHDCLSTGLETSRDNTEMLPQAHAHTKLNP